MSFDAGKFLESVYAEEGERKSMRMVMRKVMDILEDDTDCWKENIDDLLKMADPDRLHDSASLALLSMASRSSRGLRGYSAFLGRFRARIEESEGVDAANTLLHGLE